MEKPWREGEGFVWEDNTCHEVIWREENGDGCLAPTLANTLTSGVEFASSTPRIILLLLFFHPTMTQRPPCLAASPETS